jgi:Domain of unknown function (DUF4383)
VDRRRCLCRGRTAKAVNSLVGLIYLAVGVAGLFTLDSSANIIALNGLDNTLHLVAGAALLAIGRFVDRPAIARA